MQRLIAMSIYASVELFFFFQAEDGIRDLTVTGVQTCALPIYPATLSSRQSERRFAAQPLFGDRGRRSRGGKGGTRAGTRSGRLVSFASRSSGAAERV